MVIVYRYIVDLNIAVHFIVTLSLNGDLTDVFSTECRRGVHRRTLYHVLRLVLENKEDLLENTGHMMVIGRMLALWQKRMSAGQQAENA